MGFVNPTVAIIAAVCLLVVLLYKRVNLGIALNAMALSLALLALDWTETPAVVYRTSVDPLTISVVLATFGIMLLSQLYKETGILNKLSESISRLINNPKTVLCVLPAVIGLLPVAGGALMSAPLVDAEAERIGLEPRKKAYANLWFRHTVFPVYPLSPLMITAVAFMGIAMPLLILHQIPVVVAMIIVGYFIGFRKVSRVKNEEAPDSKAGRGSQLRQFSICFSPILVTIAVAVALGASGVSNSMYGFDLVVAILTGLVIMVAISRLNLSVFKRPFKSWGIYGITAAAYGAFLLKNVVAEPAISSVFSSLVSNSSVDVVLLLTVVPAVLGLLTGSAQGGIAVSVPILLRIQALTFTPKVGALVYISAYLGYVIAPTHLCFAFTADYFGCSLRRMYKYVIPSFLVALLVALLTYYLF